MPKDEALKSFHVYREAVQRSRSAADRSIMQAYKALSEGLGVLNLAAVMKQAGVDPVTWKPRLAIMRADMPQVFFKRGNSGSGYFSFSNRYYLQRRNKSVATARQQFVLPQETFASPKPFSARPNDYHHVQVAPVPPIPPQFRPADAYSKYCILWEVNEWTALAPPDDPMLLKPIGAGLYAVVAHWDLSPIEKIVLGGLLGQ